MRVVGGRRLAAVCASVLLLTGCAASTQGNPVASEDSATKSTAVASGPGDPFDPCTIPKDAVTASGLDVSTERPDFAGITTYPGWKGCTWDGAAQKSWYYVAVLSSMESIDELLLSPSFVRGSDMNVNGRTAIQLRHADELQFLGCAAAVGTDGGLIVLDLQTKGSRDVEGDPCVEVNRHAADLESYFPK